MVVVVVVVVVGTRSWAGPRGARRGRDGPRAPQPPQTLSWARTSRKLVLALGAEAGGSRSVKALLAPPAEQVGEQFRAGAVAQPGC